MIQVLNTYTAGREKPFYNFAVTHQNNMLRLYSEYTIRPAGVPDAGYPTKQTMPPAQFKAYCDRVNQKRGVNDNPAHPDYVSPETFGSTDYQEACNEALDQIKRGKGRTEDYATLIALRELNPTQPVDKKQLTLKKQEIMNDEAFRELNTCRWGRFRLTMLSNGTVPIVTLL